MLRTLTVPFVALLLGASTSFAQVRSDIISSPYKQDANAFGLVMKGADDVLLVGAPLADSFRGRVHVYERQANGTWEETTQLSPMRDDSLLFGSAIALDGDRALISAPFNETWEIDGGVVYVIERQNDGSWTSVATLGSQTLENLFGHSPESIDIEGTTAVVGSPHNGERRSGSVHVFTADGNGTWSLSQQIISPADPLDQDLFGECVDLQDGRLIVGAPGRTNPPIEQAAHVFDELSPGRWELEATLSSVTTDNLNGRFGAKVRLHGDRAFVSDPQDDRNGENSGVVHTFNRSPDGSWAEGVLITSATPLMQGYFGFSIDVDSDRLAVSSTSFFDPEGKSLELFDISDGSLLPITPVIRSTGYNSLSILDLFGSTIAHSERSATDLFDTRLVFHDLSHLGESLQTLPFPASLAAGDSRPFVLNAGPDHGNELYLILGSMSGTEPGLPIDSNLHLPLNPDAYFTFTLTRPNVWPFAHSLGVLDHQGKIEVDFAIPQGSLPGLAGTILSHAFVTFDLASFDVRFASNPVEFIIDP